MFNQEVEENGENSEEVSLNRNIVCEGRDIGTVVFKCWFKFISSDIKSRTDEDFENKK